jgi:hypothetical protein
MKHVTWAIVLSFALIAMLVLPNNALAQASEPADQSYFEDATSSVHLVFDYSGLVDVPCYDTTKTEWVGAKRQEFDPPLDFLHIYYYGNDLVCDEGLVKHWKQWVRQDDGTYVLKPNPEKIKKVKVWGMIHCVGDDDDSPYAWKDYLGWPNGKKSGKGYEMTKIGPYVYEYVLKLPPDVYSQLSSVEINYQINGKKKLWCVGPANRNIINPDTGNPELAKK